MKKQTFRKIICLTLIVLLTSSLFAGCGSNKKDTGTEKTGTSEQTSNDNAESKYAKKLDITWIGHNPVGYATKQDSEMQRLIEERFNVKITVPNLNIHNSEQWNLYWASGNKADYITCNQAGEPDKIIEQGLVREISVDLAKEKMPGWMERLESMVDSEVIETQFYYNGKPYLLPFIDYDYNAGYVNLFRQDWMENVGITKIPETIDELTELARKIVKEDPDKNGINDTYAFHDIDYFLGSYGVVKYSYNVDDNGKVYYANITDDFKEGLKTLSNWYKEGLVDPEWVTDNRDKKRNKWSEGKIAFLPDAAWWNASTVANNIKDILLEKNPDAKLGYMEPVKGPKGYNYASAAFPMMRSQSSLFGKDTSDEKVERIMDILESFCQEEDWYIRCRYGEEGRDWVKTEDGIIMPTAPALEMDYLADKGLYVTFCRIPKTKIDLKLEYAPRDVEIYELAYSLNKMYRGVGFVTLADNKSLREKGEDVKTITDEFYANAITGKINIDAEWDNYIKDMKNAGIDEIIADYQTLYEEAKVK